ncbi:hypothetical protein TELCIR_03392 [Teladorsagia circumcincta]|uniref:RRM domain-containing protein n=1 Tax=Teladorsagia circumcincta TaxID=45464 RepID=A0A2G9UWI7_TELCI|nr:hypothetical protein TELCIR_03392 [Teladorsagia circumcincta]
MSSEDAAKRQRLAELSRKKLENLHMFISPTRLMLHNLPSSMTDEKLRQICREAAGKLSHITECRIWKDTSKLDSKVKQSIGEVHGSGMKVMPKFLGKKLRHKSMSKTQLKKKNLGRKKVRKQDGLASDVAVKVKKSKDKSKKQMTKYLALSS